MNSYELSRNWFNWCFENPAYWFLWKMVKVSIPTFMKVYLTESLINKGI